MAGHKQVQVKELDLMRCQSQSSLFKQASATRSLSLHKTLSTGSQSIASAVFIQSPATSQQITVFPVANTQGKYTFNAETQDMQKQDTLWEGSTNSQKVLYNQLSAKQIFLKVTLQGNYAPFQIRSLTGLT